MRSRPLLCFSRAQLLVVALLALAGCVAPRPTATPQPHYKVGQPYKVNGHWYYPREDPDYEAVGMASWYGREFDGRRTANGEIFDRSRLSAAHTTLPLPSLVEVRNLENGRRIIVRVNDRGPFVKNRIIDLSQAAARKLGYERQGVARVRVRYLGRARLATRAPRGPQIAKASNLDPLLVGLAAEAAVSEAAPADDSISRIIDASIAEGLTAGAQTFALAEAETQARGEAPPPLGEEGQTPLLTDARAYADQAATEARATDRGGAPILAPPATAQTPPPSVSASKAAATNEQVRRTPESDAATAETLYAIQVAAFSNLNNLETTKLALNELGVLRIARLERPEGVLYRVRLGPFNDRGSAAEALAAVQEAGYGDAKIITITP